jgi:DNA topoisomerase-1
VPTDIGKIVNRFLTHYFHRYVEYGFTAAMEDELDAVSRGEEEWTTPLRKFWKPFIQQVQKTEKNVTREQVAQAREIGKDPVTGKPMTVRMGRFGPFVQIGTKDDAEKPRFAGLRPGQKMDAITLEHALELFKLPRTLGETAEGEVILANVGRFGPYIKYGAKYVSIKDDDPYTVSLERALELIRLKKEADASRLIAEFASDGLKVLNGRYGPYVTDGKKNAKIPKDRDPKSLTLEDCRALIAAAPERGTGRFGRGRRAAAPAAVQSPAADGAAPKKQAPRVGAAAKAKLPSHKSQPQKNTHAVARSKVATPPKPKGVTHIVRKGRSAAAKSHARKVSARKTSAVHKASPGRARGMK